MRHIPRLGTLALAVMLTSAACSSNDRNPVSYPGGGPRPSVGERDERDERGNGNRNSARPDKNKGSDDGARCNAGNGNGNGNGRCRNGNRGRGNP